MKHKKSIPKTKKQDIESKLETRRHQKIIQESKKQKHNENTKPL
jgi:hypothetical protein